MTNQTISDLSQRQQALDPTRSFIVQAPAGSGKTELLTQRYLVLLAQAQTPEEILAITFTRKAAAQMRTRIIAALQNAASQAMPNTEHAKKTWQLATAALTRNNLANWQLLENPNRLRIQTIDSLCAYLTQRLPVLSHFGSQPNIVEDPNLLYTQAARSLLNTLETNMPWVTALECILLHLDNDQNKAERLLINMLACRDQWLPYLLTAKRSQDIRNILEQTLCRILEENLKNLAVSLPKEHGEELISLMRFSAKNLDASNPIHAGAELKALPLPIREHYPQWIAIANLLLTKDFQWRKNITVREGFPAAGAKKGKNFGESVNEAMKQRMLTLLTNLASHTVFRKNLQAILESPPPHYTDQQWEIVEALVETLPILAAQLHVTFKERGVVDYIEIASSALQALGDADHPTDLALALDYRIQHILVDEFQDTSAAQYRLLEQLTAGWQMRDGRTLFLVGDPMQSIYRFRKAEVGLFLRTKERGIGHIQLTNLTLSTNFRSTTDIVMWINTVFASLLPEEEDISAGAVPYKPCTAIQENLSAPAVTIHPLIDSDSSTEAKAIVSLVKNTLEKRPTDSIAILVKARSHLIDILPALQNAGIVYHATEIEVLAQRTVIYDLLALTNALLHPAHRTAWLAILRAPWCGLTLSDLHLIAGNDHTITIWERLKSYDTLPLSIESKQRIKRMYEILSQSLQQRYRKPLRQWVEKTWYALGGPACVTHSAELQNAQRFFALLQEMECGGDIPDLDQLMARLETLFAASSQSTNKTLEIMTIHKAKGLEFDTVIIPSLGRKPRSDSHQLLLWMERPTATGIDLLLGPIKSTATNHDPIYNYIRREESKKSRHEMGRLLYVAATRAKKYLHLIGDAQTLSDKKQLKPPLENSLLALLWPQLEPTFLSENNTRNTLQTSETITSQNKPFRYKRLTIDYHQVFQTFSDISFIDANTVKNTAASVTQETDPMLRHIGTVVHRILCQLSQHDLDTWDEKKIQAQQAYWRNSLKQLGLIENVLEHSVTLVTAAITNTLSDPRGRWILDKHHQDAQSEYPISGIIDNNVVNFIVDRTFVDEQERRWIIDYKTTDYRGDDLTAFITQEQNRHRPQLTTYAEIFRHLDERPISLGLYFPLLGEWRTY